MGKLADVQKLRAFAVFMVLFGHLPFTMPNILIHGYTGVSLFFVISGYVVTLSILRKPPAGRFFDRRNVAWLRDFYLRRIFRLLPVAVIWVLIYFCIGQFISAFGGSYGDMSRWANEIKWFGLGIYNYGYAASHMPGLFGHYWSLAVETHFYLILPILLLVLSKRSYRIGMCVLAILLVSTWLRMITPSESIGLLTHTQADALFSGVLMALVFSGGDDPFSQLFGKLEERLPQLVKNAVSLSLLGALFVLPSWMDTRVEPILKYPVFTALAVVIVFLAQREAGWIAGGSRAVDTALLYVGDRSYSLYVSHVILYSGVYVFVTAKYAAAMPTWITQTASGVAAQAAFLVLAAVAVAAFSYRYIEQPYIDFGKKVIRGLDERSAQAAA
ncbi:MAG TPA: acyltransferase [Coriobacteriia bacterium]|nr:acyltransferase [Coriobacteriia bacterium]